MFLAFRRLISRRVRLAFILLAAVILSATTSISLGQRQRTGAEEPLFTEFKGVRIGTPVDEARKKLGSPSSKADDQDLYVDDNQIVQVYYDKAKTVSAISIDFSSGATGIPAPKEVIGGEPETKADGSAYKMVRYPKLGYWVSYSRTAERPPP